MSSLIQQDKILSMYLVTGYCRKYQLIITIPIPTEIIQLCLIYYQSHRIQTYTIQPPLKYTSLSGMTGSLAIVDHVKNVSYGSMVNISQQKFGEIIELSDQRVIISVFEGCRGIYSGSDTQFEFTNKIMRIGVSTSMLGRIFNGIGTPIDGIPNFIPETMLQIKYNLSTNPSQRIGKSRIIETGISVIDTMTPIKLGSKVALMSGFRLPHNQILMQIMQQFKLLNKDGTYESSAKVCIVFVSIGNDIDTSRFFEQRLKESGLMMDSVLFINSAIDPTIERTIMPHIAMTVAEYFSFVHDRTVIVILHDMSLFADAYREKLVPPTAMGYGKKYPYELKSELSSIFERAGVFKGHKGSITVLSVVTMPNDDINHPIPQWIANSMDTIIYIDRHFPNNMDMYPSINKLKSVSYSMQKLLMKGGFTRDDHLRLVDKIFKHYVMAKDIEIQRVLIGDGALTSKEKLHLRFLDKFNTEFLRQKENECRSIQESLQLLEQLLFMFSFM